MSRFYVVNLEPGRIWSEYGIVDSINRVVIAKSSHEPHAEVIASALNKCAPIDADAKQLPLGTRGDSIYDPREWTCAGCGQKNNGGWNPKCGRCETPKADATHYAEVDAEVTP